MLFRARRAVPGILLAVAITACHSTASVAPSPTERVSRGDGGSVAEPLASAPPIPEARAPEPVVDLLREVPCIVVVSSKVDNPSDFPEHLVDGRPETAWSSKTGDLKPFLLVRTPREVRITRLELTVGFDKVTTKGDLFFQNHRITKVRIVRDARVVREAALDPAVRGFQGIDLDEPGGDLRIEVLETLPGTKKAWREVTVSELRVLGHTNGAPPNPSRMPRMALGSFDGVPERPRDPSKPPPGPFPTIAALCAAYEGAMGKAIARAFPGDRYPGTLSGPHCAPYRDAAVAATVRRLVVAPFVDAVALHVNDTSTESVRLALATDRGFALTDVTLWRRYHDDPGCGHASQHDFEDATTITLDGKDVAVFRVLHTDIYWIAAPDPGGTFEHAFACRPDRNGAAFCEGPVVTGRSPGWPDGWDPAKGTYPRVTVGGIRWVSRRSAILGPAGDLRLGP